MLMLDQDYKKSVRLSGVWKSQDSPDAVVIKQERPQHCLQEAAAWINALTGARVTAEEERFRHELSDGILLCKLLIVLLPDAPVHVNELLLDKPDAAEENVVTFIRRLQDMKVPSEYIFTFGELQAGGEAATVKVVNCILWLKRMHAGHGETAMDIEPTNDLSPVLDSFRKTSSQNKGMHSQTSSARTSSSWASQSLYHATGSSLVPTASTGVAQLLTQWSTILKANMHGVDNNSVSQSVSRKVNSQSSEFSVDSMGPIFHNVLSNLTTDYERKLSAKDQEVNNARVAVKTMQLQMTEVQNQLSQVKNQLVSQQHSAPSAHQIAEIQELEQSSKHMQLELHEREKKCIDLQRQLDSMTWSAQQQVQALQMQIGGLSQQLDMYEALDSKYHATREENKRLYNLVQDLKGSIRVYCRIRPAGRTGDSSSSCMEVGEEGELALHDSTGQTDCPRVYRYDKIFNEASTQAEVYEDTQPLIRSVLDGYNVCIFAYGQTGSGKTHTMSGTNVENTEGQGINYRALQDLFQIIEDRQHEMDYTIKVQMLEIYNEALRDLLIKDQKSAVPLELLMTMASGCNVKNAEQLDVKDPSAVLEIMERGSRNRHVAGTNMNERSSRSHQVLTVIVDGVSKVTGACTHSCLNLVDLAGSERVSKSKASGDRLVETCNINSSLSALGDVMAALASRSAHVPYRNSKLTQLLSDSLSGQAKVMMFMHIAPESNFMSESESTLRFGNKVASVTLGQAKRNVDNSKFFANEEITRTRKEMAEKDEALLSLQRKLHEERKQKEQLQREMDRLKSQVDSRRNSLQEPLPSCQETFATPSHKSQMKPLVITQPLGYSTPVATPTGQPTPNSARRSSLYKSNVQSRIDSGLKSQADRPLVPPLGLVVPPLGMPPLVSRSFSVNRSISGSQTARFADPSGAYTSRASTSSIVPPPASSSRPSSTNTTTASASSSARPGGVYGLARSSSSVHNPMSSRVSGMYSSSSGLSTIPAVATVRTARVTSGSVPVVVPQSAGGRRQSTGGWKS